MGLKGRESWNQQVYSTVVDIQMHSEGVLRRGDFCESELRELFSTYEDLLTLRHHYIRAEVASKNRIGGC